MMASARALQQSSGEGQVALLRDLRESAWAVMCSEMYGNLGLPIHRHRLFPDMRADDHRPRFPL